MAAERTTADLRLVIDVSGSMKKNDPQNLRAPAVRLLVGMMPENTHSGIWSFGQRVTSLLPVGKIDPEWRRKARDAANKIQSREMYTDIEQALREATRDWVEPHPRFHRNIILLTDGLVDISKDRNENEASRRRILEQLLPRIAASGAKIHTVALSSNSDHSLMEALSAATGGWYEQVEDARTLDRIFLRLFEQGTSPDTLPLKGNRFTVDESISDMTVLAFRYLADESLNLVTPSGERFSMLDYPPNVRWLRETNYDLVTVETPLQGEWRLDAPEDPDNRVTVVTNLRLEVESIPAHFTVADAPMLYARLRYGSTNARRPDFLDWVQFSLDDTQHGSGEKTTIPLRDGGEPPDTAAGDGTYSAVFGDDLAPGLHELVVVADGGSFSREYRQMVRVYAHAVSAQIVPEGGDSSETQEYRLDVRVEPALLQTENLQVRGYLDSADTTGIPLVRIDHDKWRMALPPASSWDVVELEINGLGRSGNPYHLSRRLRIDTEEKQPEAQAETEEIDALVEDGQQPQATPSEMNWSITAILVVVENLLLGFLVWLGYTLWKRRTADKETPEPKAEQSVEAADPETDGSTQSPEVQSSAAQSGTRNAASEDETSQIGTPASTVPPKTEQDAPHTDGFTIERLDDELSATLEAGDDQSTDSRVSDEERDASARLGDAKSLEEGATGSSTSARGDTENEQNDTWETAQTQSTASNSTADASSTDEARKLHTVDIQRGEPPEEAHS